MDVVLSALAGGGKVLLAGLAFGAGLPALFAIAMWALSQRAAAAAAGDQSRGIVALATAVVCLSGVALGIMAGVLLITSKAISYHFGINIF